MRFAPRAILAGGLGFAVAFVAACGGSSGLLSSDQSMGLSGQADEIASAVQSGNCGAAINASFALNREVRTLPLSVNPTLRRNLSQGASTIAELAAKDCHAHTTPTVSPRTTSSTTTTSTSTPTSTSTSTTTPTTTSTTTTSSTSTSATTPTDTGSTSTTGGVGVGSGTSTGNGNGNSNGSSGGAGPSSGTSSGTGGSG